MAIYTLVVVAPNELEQDEVIQIAERIGVVAFCGPGSLVSEDAGVEAEPVCEVCGTAQSGPPFVRAGLALCEECDLIGAALASGDDDRAVERFGAARVEAVEAALGQRAAKAAEPIVAYAVHVEGALWDDPQISAWGESVYDVASNLERAEAFFAEDEDGVPLLTIVRAEFTGEEWEKARELGWTLDSLPSDPEDSRSVQG